MSQQQQIFDHLKRWGSITPAHALRHYGVNRLAARIQELRERGHDIQTEMIKVKTRKGSARVARYRYVR